MISDVSKLISAILIFKTDSISNTNNVSQRLQFPTFKSEDLGN